MQVTLAGYNLDNETIELIKQAIDLQRQEADSDIIADILQRLVDEPLTPETISAAYARISRSEKGVKELRRDARSSVSRARQSNEKIVFGLGHASVSEHAAFNLDVTDASRLALEELESHRLVSYTESSQRYISMQGDFAVPDEIVASGKEELFKNTCNKLFEGYRKISDLLEEYHKDLPQRDRQGRAREDARYLLPLACRGQVGVTVNARNAEWIIQQSSQSRLSEVREMGNQLARILRRLTPSLIRYTEPNPRWVTSEMELKNLFSINSSQESDENREEVKLVSVPVDAENFICAAIGFRVGASSFGQTRNYIEGLDKSELIRLAHIHLTQHTPVRRELELASLTFELVLSASAYAQLKRHRMATLINQEYNPQLGITIPPAVVEAGVVNEFYEYIMYSTSSYEEISEALPVEGKFPAQYILTNAHRRRILFHANIREMIHLSRLREDEHAQWDIRELSKKMIKLGKEKCPILFTLAAGKDKFDLVQAMIDGEINAKK